MHDLHDYLTINWVLWYLWLPCVGMAAYNMGMMYTLDAPHSLGGRISRVLAHMGMITGMASPLNFIGFPVDFPLVAISYPLLLASFCALTTQYSYECRARKRKEAEIKAVLGIVEAKPTSTTEKIVTAIVGKPDQLRREDHLWQGSENKINNGA